jgi:ribosomal protein S3AE
VENRKKPGGCFQMVITKKKKKFFDVEIPLINKQTQLQAYGIEELEKRNIIYDLTRILKGKNLIMGFHIEIKDGQAIALPNKAQILPCYITRMMRKGTNYVEDSFSTACKDTQVRIKPFLITRRKVSRQIRKALRNKAREELKEYAKNKTAEELFEDVIKNSIQRELSLKLKKVYPLSLCEIRILKIERQKKRGE